ncbi:heat shock protein [Opitutaceae bacterium TAV1]|nr:heat-shock protein [Opitutaceae bacterium TAV5]EIQ01972.1 heat shock protein [Opitutaceae bacterium TAV1]
MNPTNIARSFAPVAFAAVLALTGCQQTATTSASQDSAPQATATKASVPTTSADALRAAANTYWDLDTWTSADGTSHLPTLVTLRLGEGGRVTGSSGENAYFGTAALAEDGSLDWGRALAATRITGSSPDVVKRETAYIADLKATTQVAFQKKRLVFTGPDALRLEFVPAKGE